MKRSMGNIHELANVQIVPEKGKRNKSSGKGLTHDSHPMAKLTAYLLAPRAATEIKQEVTKGGK